MNKLTNLTILLFALSLAFFLSSSELTRLHFGAEGLKNFSKLN